MGQSYRFPTVVVALGLISLALVDAVVALVNWQLTDVMKAAGGSLSALTGGTVANVGNSGWYIDLAAAGVSMVVAVMLLYRPDRIAMVVAASWSAIAFLANFFNRKGGTVDGYSLYRCPVYFLAFVGLAVLIYFQYAAAQTQAAKAAAEVPPAPGA